jgi:hypothetical protein
MILGDGLKAAKNEYQKLKRSEIQKSNNFTRVTALKT